ncbi:MAG: Hsp20/alpha crystallin family protein [Bdellovibrionales bacterium]|nr:Hsp20/alpha crystallin family protein [Bdellovibrionales bacterium]
MRKTLTHKRPQTVWDFMNEMNSVFDEAFHAPSTWGQTTGFFQPVVDIEENKDYYLMSFDLPGIDKDQINIDLSENTLTVSGERTKEVKSDNDNGFKKYEKSYGKFERRFSLPSKIDAEKIQARHENGVLEVMIPKAEIDKPKNIKIESSGSLFSRLLGKNDTSKGEH